MLDVTKIISDLNDAVEDMLSQYNALVAKSKMQEEYLRKCHDILIKQSNIIPDLKYLKAAKFPIDAIKLLREKVPMSLLDAKNYIEVLDITE